MKSFFKGLLYMRPNSGKVNYGIKIQWFGRKWFQLWTPVWHSGRGPYVSIGFYFIAFYRGY